MPRARAEGAATLPPSDSAKPLTLTLKWDFRSSFPEPTPEAIDAGVIPDQDTSPESIRAIHEEHAREALMALQELDVVLDARRRGVDPGNDKAPALPAAKERLGKFFETEPARLERWWQNLLDVYEEGFGAEAVDAFARALRARHAGIPVIADEPRVTIPTVAVDTKPSRLGPQNSARERHPRRVVARLPVPRPLPSAVAAGRFGQEENGKPVNPGAHEVREITEQHAENLIDLLDSLAAAPANRRDVLQLQFDAGIATYREDFGPHAADQLKAYVTRQASLESGERRQR
jgi:hypothetical protein